MRVDYLFTFLSPLKIRLPELTAAQLDLLTDTLTDAEIGALAGVTRTAATNHRRKWGVLSWAQKHGTRRYKESYEPRPGAKRAFSHRLGCNERCFERIETPAQAYWLGMLAADGWIVTHHQESVGVALALHPRDRDLLREYASFVGFHGEPRRTRPGAELYQVKITSKLMASDLAAQGIVPRKSKVLRLPGIDQSLMPHFVRGLFDGDGSVTRRENSLSAQITTGSSDLVDGLKAWLDTQTPRPCSIGKDRDAYVLRWYADNAEALAWYMYAGDPAARPRMERKARIFFGCPGSGAGHSWEQLLSGLDSAPSR